LADKKITQLNNITGADLANSDEFVVVDITADETKAITFDELKTAFDTGTGFVRVTGDTMTGALNVESTITADGLTVDGDITLTAGDKLKFNDDRYFTPENNVDGAEVSANGIFRVKTGATPAQRLLVGANGDISFYEDTGTTAKFFWDASAERLSVPTLSITDGSITTTAAAGDHTVFNSTGADADFRVRTGANSHSLFVQGNTGNIGIGTSSPSTYGVDGAEDLVIGQADGNHGLTISSFGSSNGTIAFSDQTNVAVGRGYLDYDHSVNAMTVGTNGSERMRIDSSGNVGIGCVPNSIQSNFDTLQIGGNLTLNVDSTGANAGVYMGNNVYRDSTNSRWEYIYTDEASQYYQANGNHVWRTASSGSANAAISWSERMRIDSSGRVGIGTSSPNSPLEVSNGTENHRVAFGTGEVYLMARNASSYITQEYIANQHVFTGYGDNSSNEAMRIDSSGNVGIGTSSPTAKLHVDGTLRTTGSVTHNSANLNLTADDARLLIEEADGTDIVWLGDISGTGIGGSYLYNHGGTATVQMRADQYSTISKGILIDDSSAGVEALKIQTPRNDAISTGLAYINVTDSVAPFSALTIDHNGTGKSIEFRDGGTTAGSISVSSDKISIGSAGGSGLYFGTTKLQPMYDNSLSDNTIDVGHPSYRFNDIYATNGTIQTSDFNEKQDIASLTATEMLVGARISTLFKTFRWKDSVAENGDNARTHTGVIAQDVQAAFTAEGLDAGDYALFISSTWWEHDVDVPAVEAVEAVEAVTETTTDEEGNEVVTVITEAVEAVEAKDAYTRTDTYDTEAEAPEGATSKTRLGIRYPELLSFVAAYNEQRFASIEARLTALEG